MATNNSINANIPIPVSAGGTGLTSGNSGGIPYYSASNAITSSATLGLNQIVTGSGVGGSPVSNSTFTYINATAQALVQSSALQPKLTILTTNIASGNESAVFLERAQASTGYAQIHLLTAGVEDWALGTRANSTNLSFFKSSSAFSPYSFSSVSTKYDFTVSTNIAGSLNESSVTLSRGDQANGYGSLYFQTAGTTDFVIQTAPGSRQLNVYSQATASNVLLLSTSGLNSALSQPKTPFLFATSNTLQSNVTGNGVTYNVVFANVVTDQTSAFNSLTGVFTAQFTGNYQFTFTCGLQNIAGSHTSYQVQFLCAGVPYILAQGNPGTERTSPTFQLTRNITLSLRLTAGQTCQCQIQVNASTQTVGILNANQTSFQARFVS
jgi:hypothetical protein